MGEMNPTLADPLYRRSLKSLYRDTLLKDVIPFWMKHAMDREHDGIITTLDRDGSILDTDKSIWFHGRFQLCIIYWRNAANGSRRQARAWHFWIKIAIRRMENCSSP